MNDTSATSSTSLPLCNNNESMIVVFWIIVVMAGLSCILGTIVTAIVTRDCWVEHKIYRKTKYTFSDV